MSVLVELYDFAGNKVVNLKGKNVSDILKKLLDANKDVNYRVEPIMDPARPDFAAKFLPYVIGDIESVNTTINSNDSGTIGGWSIEEKEESNDI